MKNIKYDWCWPPRYGAKSWICGRLADMFDEMCNFFNKIAYFFRERV